MVLRTSGVVKALSAVGTYSAFRVPFRLQQELTNEANVASHGTSLNSTRCMRSAHRRAWAGIPGIASLEGGTALFFQVWDRSTEAIVKDGVKNYPGQQWRRRLLRDEWNGAKLDVHRELETHL